MNKLVTEERLEIINCIEKSSIKDDEIHEEYRQFQGDFYALLLILFDEGNKNGSNTK